MSAKKKQKQIPLSEAEYLETFCIEKRIRNRCAVYVSRETHDLLLKVVNSLSDYHVTTMSMADAIFRHHFESNKELLNRLYKEDLRKYIVKPVRHNESDPEDEPD